MRVLLSLLEGDTVFMATARSELCRVQPRAGMALLHAHGRRCLMHYGEVVTRGAKYVLRADVLYRRSNATPAEPANTGSAEGRGAHAPGSKVRKGKKR